MDSPLILIAAIIVISLFCVVLPFIRDVYRRFPYRKVVRCPDTHDFAEVRLNAGWAALTALFDKPKLRVQSCTLWPRKKGCREACVKENWPSE